MAFRSHQTKEMSKPVFSTIQEQPLSSEVVKDQNIIPQSKSMNPSSIRPPKYIVASIIVACAAMLFGYGGYKLLRV